MNRKALILSVVGILMIAGAMLSTDRGRSIVSALAGHRSAATGASVALAWSPSLSAGVAGNKLHYGTQAGNYDQVLDVGTQTIATASNLAPGTQYFFAATAYDSTGNESSFSNEVAYRPASPTPGPTGTPGASPSASPPRTPTPGTVGITLNPNPLNFVGVPNVQPTPQTVQITTSNGAAWTSRDVLTWLDTDNPTGMPSGSFLTVKPNAGIGGGTYNGDITITASGLPTQLLHVKLTVGSSLPTVTPRPTLTPAPTVSPSPVPTVPPSPSPSVSPAPSASPSCTPCLCGR